MVRLLGSTLLFCLTHSGFAQPFGELETRPFGLTPMGTGALEMPNGYDLADMDGDGDLDFLLFHQESLTIYYYELIVCDGQLQFAAPIPNPFGLSVPEPGFLAYHTFVVTDMDGDGDKDILLGDLMRPFLLLENSGTKKDPAFEAPVANGYYLEDGSLRPHAFGDIDNDGDLDVLTTVYLGGSDSKICLMENRGQPESPDFLLPGDLDHLGDGELGLGNGDFADFDHDGDPDYLHTEVDGNLTFHENLGIEGEISFGPEQVNPWGFAKASENNSTARLADIDRDGDLDYFELDLFNGELYFRENLAPPGDQEIIPGIVSNLELFPNDTGTALILSLELLNSDELISMRILDQDGRVYAEAQLVSTDLRAEAEININNLSGGTYLLELYTSLGNYQRTLVKAK